MGRFELLNPPGLWLLTGLVPLVALYILKVKRPRVRIGSTWLWAAAERDLLAKKPFRKLVAELPLILQIAALIALAIALARPAARGTTLTGDHIAIVIDASASMGTTSRATEVAESESFPSATRLGEAQRAAMRIVSALGASADALIIEGAREGRVVSPPDRDRIRLKSAVGRVAARDVEGDLSSAVALASERLRALGGKKRIVVITDTALAHEVPLVADGIDTEILRVGTAEDNAAIIRVDVRGGVDPLTQREQIQVFALVRNYANRARDAFVTVSIVGQADPLASRRVLLPPQDKVAIVLTFDPKSSDRDAGLVVQLSPNDALAVDDVAYGRVPAGLKMPVTIASRAFYSWIARAVDADLSLDTQKLTLEQLGSVNIPADALVIVEGACPEDAPGGDLLIVAPPPGRCMGIDVGNLIPSPSITSWESFDPRLRFLTLDGVHISQSRALDAGKGSKTESLVRSATSTLIADASTPGRSVTLIGFDVGESDWPLKASFVLFVRNVVEWAKLHRAQGPSGPARAGEPLRVSVPSSVTTVRVNGPGKIDQEFSAKDGFAIIPAVERVGIYNVRWTAPHVGETSIAVNLSSERESDIRPRAMSMSSSSSSSGPIADDAATTRLPDAHNELGAWFALIAAIVLAFDVYWLTRPSRPARPSRSAHATARSPISGVVVPGATALAFGVLPLAYEVLVRFGVVSDAYLRFERPATLVLGAIASVWLLSRFMKLPARMSDARRSLVIVWTSFTVLASLLVLAGPDLGRPLDRLTIVVAVDRSRSIDLVPNADARLRSEMKVAELGMHDDDRIGTVVFGADAKAEDPPRPHSALLSPQRVEVGRDGTHIEAAMRRALSELPSDTAGRIVLLSDGVQTRGDALSAAAAAMAANIPVDVVVLEQKSIPNVRVVAVRTLSRADEGEAIDLRVVTESTAATDVEIRVKRDGELVHKARGSISQGEDILRLRETAGAPGFHRYDVEMTAIDASLDGTPEDNSGSAFVRVRGPSLAVVFEGTPEKAAPIANALTKSGFRVDVRPATGIPSDIGGLAGFDLVVLSDVRASDMAASQIELLASYARDLGGGLLLMGGDQSMGPGGYARTPVEEVSPVAFDLKKETRRASLAEVIAIDYSGSMGATVSGQTKLALANEAAARSASLLGPGDRLGVEHVDDRVAWTLPLAPVTDAKAIAAKIRAVSLGGGGIYTDIALKEGYEALTHESVNLKHLLLFADGDDAERLGGCRALVTKALARRMTTSVISLGRGNDTRELEVLSKLGGGRFYLIDDATKLPAVFTQETILATKSAINEVAFHVSAADPSPATRGIDLSRAPELKGYVVTAPKPRATVSLAGPEGDPILASWAAGIGRVSAFTSDYKDRWGSAWLTWPGAAQMFGQLGRDTARKAGDPRVRLDSDASSGELHLRADVVGDDGRAQTFRRLTVHVAGPDGFARDVPLEAVGAGRYSATIPLTRPGTYVAAAKDDASNESVGMTGAVLTAGEEMRPTGSDRTLLTRIATMTGGKARDTLAGLFQDRAARRFAFTPLGPFLLLASGIALVASVGARRLGIPEFVGRGMVRIRTLRNARKRSAKSARHAESESAITEPPQIREPAAHPGANPTRHAATPPSVPPATSAAVTPAAPEERPMTTAERLVKKRRERQ